MNQIKENSTFPAVMRSSAFRSLMTVFCTMETLRRWRNQTALFSESIVKPLVPTGQFNPKTKPADNVTNIQCDEFNSTGTTELALCRC